MTRREHFQMIYDAAVTIICRGVDTKEAFLQATDLVSDETGNPFRREHLAPHFESPEMKGVFAKINADLAVAAGKKLLGEATQ